MPKTQDYMGLNGSPLKVNSIMSKDKPLEKFAPNHTFLGLYINCFKNDFLKFF